MEAETVRDQAQSLELVTQILAQVISACLLPLCIGYEYICLSEW